MTNIAGVFIFSLFEEEIIVLYYDETQRVLGEYLSKTELLMNELLSKKFSGFAQVRVTTDLGFPHDVIRIAGGFATGVHVSWESKRPFVPVDTCVNVCSASFFEIDRDILDLFTDDYMNSVRERLSQGIYISNFHRGNHFISYLRSRETGKLFLLLHSSANEFKDNFNGLYPVKGNWYFDKIKVYSNGKTYINYLDDKDAEFFYRLAEGLYNFNEIRHEFIAQVILGSLKNVINVQHFHHYGMPTPNSIVMGSHILKNGEIAPVLTMPGQNIYMVKFNSAKDNSLLINKSQFITPHGWGKRHKNVPQISLDLSTNSFTLDDESYNIEFGTSLRAHANLELRDFNNEMSGGKENFFSYLKKMYCFEISDEMEQIASWNKAGVRIW